MGHRYTYAVILAGQERFRAVTKCYYRGAAGAILVYDISRRSTFEHIQQWLKDAKEGCTPHTVLFLIGNKSDLEDQREVTKEEASKFALDNNMTFMEASSKSGQLVEDVFLESAKQIMEKVDKGIIHLSQDSGVQRRLSLMNPQTVVSQRSGFKCC